MDEREIFAALADAAYGNDGKINHESSIPSGWSLIKRDYNGDGTVGIDEGYKTSISGFAAAAYKNGNEIIISYRGTTNLNDWLTGNAGIMFDKIMEQYYEANKFYYTIRDENPTAIISFAGHSLGGALAQLMGAYCSTSPFEKDYYGSTYAFNAPGVSHLLDNLGISQTSFASIHNYVNMSDLVGNLFNISLFGYPIADHLGSTEFLNPSSLTSLNNKDNDLFWAHSQYNSEPLTNQPNWTGTDGISLWLFDSANTTSAIKQALNDTANEETFKTAFEKLQAMGTPKETQHYSLKNS